MQARFQQFFWIRVAGFLCLAKQVLEDCENPPVPGFCRIIEDGTFERELEVVRARSSDDAIKVEVVGNQLIIEVGPGRDTSEEGFSIFLRKRRGGKRRGRR